MRTAGLTFAALLLAGCGASAPAPTDLASPTQASSFAPTNPSTPFTVEVTPSPTPTASPTRAPATARPATPTPLARQDLEIIDSGFQVVDGYVSFAVIGHNPNPSKYIVNYLPLQVTFYEGDSIVKTAEEAFSTVLPDQTTATTGFDEMDGRPDRMEVRMGTTDWVTVDFSTGHLLIDEVSTKPDRFSGWVTKGTAESTFDNRQENVRITVVHRNDDGQVIGGDFTFIDFIDPGTKIAFEVDTIVDLRGVDTGAAEVYWSL